MSAIELAVRKVRKLSVEEARELLAWLATRQPNVGVGAVCSPILFYCLN